MGTRSVRLDEDTYERIKRQKQPDETFSEAIDRLTRTPSLGELGGVVDEERVERVEAAIVEADAADADEVNDILDEFDNR
ncbi:antitoxin VapB family protein [Natranaeroarchaeum aerophilus]|uniref:Antitoxin VapB family protein n=1 Tax=Natranaeroarchaeum aerophilus TaxID=2917711 RepID=A0AAE3FS96_9EURY|nr:antitoxin VapB family protein [Natranaeroarchaeum aerophilus]MCL9814389.1 antitoxin VapB family protein [Natranaeroarchaeum aerophilus]